MQHAIAQASLVATGQGPGYHHARQLCDILQKWVTVLFSSNPSPNPHYIMTNQATAWWVLK
jgi:hypothetical protein